MAEWISVKQARLAESVDRFAADPIEIRGWVRTRRDSKGGFSFLEINDGSSGASRSICSPAPARCRLNRSAGVRRERSRSKRTGLQRLF